MYILLFFLTLFLYIYYLYLAIKLQLQQIQNSEKQHLTTILMICTELTNLNLLIKKHY